MNKSSIKSLILMATYNGEKYLRKQIESIIHQTNKNWKLLIRDDGSTDSTVFIIREYMEKDQRISLIMNKTNKHGAYLNFWTLIDYAHTLEKYEYYFFADQDDIWDINKIEIMTKYANIQNPSNKPFMLYSDMRVINGKDECIYESVNKIMGNGEMKGLSLFFSHGFIWGCTVLVNNALFELVPVFPLNSTNIKIMSHDNYFGKYALLFGKLRYLDMALINHRRHDSNTTGGYNLKLTPMAIVKKSLIFFDRTAQIHALVYNQTMLMIKVMRSNNLDDKYTYRIQHAIETGGIEGCRILKKMGVKRKQWIRTLGIYIIMASKVYKKYLLEDFIYE